MTRFPEKSFNRIKSAKELLDRIGTDYKDRTLFKYYGEGKTICEMKYEEFAEKTLCL